MNPEVKPKWVEALRSGAYKQGKYALRELGDLYDATGVLCELAVKEGIIGAPQKFDDPDSVFKGYRYGERGDYYATGLPKAVVDWSGVAYRTGYKVAMMGDYGKNFDKIADWIEENL